MRVSIFVSSFVALATTAAAIPVSEHQKRQSGTFDYVVIGGGTAGLAIANRLSEDRNVKVAVIEPGTSHQLTSPVLSTTPAGDVVFVGASPTDQNLLVDWHFVTTPQPGANGRSLSYTRGKCLGGSSARNFMIYQRGDKGSYQKWADAVGDDSYTFDNLMPYFKKSVKFTPPNTELRAPNATAEYNTDAFSPTGGPLEVTYANYAGPFSSYMELGMNAIGIPTIQDFNSGTLLGTQYCASTIRAKEQKRDSSETSFLYHAQTRPNLQVYTLTRAHKIIFDENKQATGVDIGLGVVLSVRKEVILSAGTFQSPQILMLSGIGPKETLDQYNIPVIADRPGVGQNMQDHVMFGITYRYNVETLTRLANDLVYTAKKFAVDYTLFKRGVFTSPVADFIAWEKAPRNLLTSEAAAVLDEYPASWPEIEYFSTPGLVGDFSNVLMSQPNDGYQYASILGALVAPLSRGNVTIKSNSIFDLPEINPNWLTDPTDVSVAIAAFKRLRQAFATDAMRAGESDENEYAPGAKVQTDEQILDTIRSTLITVWHASCTCKMGKTDDPMAVVDTRARVIGVKGLRVVDASAMALLPAGHPQSTIYALAEKIADDIKNGR